MKDKFQDRLIENVMDDDNKKYENFAKVIFLATELLEKDKIMEITNNIIKK